MQRYEAIPADDPNLYVERLELLKQIRQNLTSIVEDYSGSSLAVQLISEGRAKMLVLTEIEGAIAELEEKGEFYLITDLQELRTLLVVTDAELTSMTMAFEEQRRRTEDADAESQRQVALLNEQVALLRQQLGAFQGLLDASAARDAAAEVQIVTLGNQLNAALARIAAEQQQLAREQARVAELDELSRYRSEFFGRLRTLLEGREGVSIERDRLVFSSEVLFEIGSADLASAGLEQIANVASLLNEVAGEIPDTIDWILRVDGHTDNRPLRGDGDFASNWELSQARALSVVQYLAEELGFPSDRLAATGFGEYNPVTTNDTAAGRAQNRRIELKLTER